MGLNVNQHICIYIVVEAMWRLDKKLTVMCGDSQCEVERRVDLNVSQHICIYIVVEAMWRLDKKLTVMCGDS